MTNNRLVNPDFNSRIKNTGNDNQVNRDNSSNVTVKNTNNSSYRPTYRSHPPQGIYSRICLFLYWTLLFSFIPIVLSETSLEPLGIFCCSSSCYIDYVY